MNVQEYKLAERDARAVYIRLMLRGVTSVAWLVATSAGQIKNLRQTKASEAHYTRPPRGYELPAPLPEPQPGQQPGLQPRPSPEIYLRPTRFCNPQAPEVQAMAQSLGAGRLEPPEYVQAAFEFVKEKMLVEILPLDGVEASLGRGAGTCIHLISVFIALCRNAGIPARYKMFAQNLSQAWRAFLIDVDPLAKKWYDALGYFMIEGEGEVWLDGRWVVANVGPTAERQAAAGMPVTRLGEDGIGLWIDALPGTIMHLESIPPGLGLGTSLLYHIAPGSMERINLSVTQQSELGKQALAAAGGLQAYDRLARSRLGPRMPVVDLRPRPEIVFGKP